MYRKVMVLALVLGLGACASIMHGSSQEVGLSSSPTAAKVTVDNLPLGNTPIVANLKRGNNHVVKFELAGYEPFEATITKKVSGWVWGNIVFGGLIGLGVDAMTGGLYQLTPEQIAGAMTKKGGEDAMSAATMSDGKTLQVFVVMRADPTWKKIGQLQRD
jgi:hypothetical protein